MLVFVPSHQEAGINEVLRHASLFARPFEIEPGKELVPARRGGVELRVKRRPVEICRAGHHVGELGVIPFEAVREGRVRAQVRHEALERIVRRRGSVGQGVSRKRGIPGSHLWRNRHREAQIAKGADVRESQRAGRRGEARLPIIRERRQPLAADAVSAELVPRVGRVGAVVFVGQRHAALRGAVQEHEQEGVGAPRFEPELVLTGEIEL